MRKSHGSVLGIDIGTTSISAVLISPTDGSNIITHFSAHGAEISPDIHGGHLQNPTVILSAAAALIDKMINETEDIRAIGVTGQMHSVSLVDDNGRAVTPIYTWLDQRLNNQIGNNGNGRELFAAEYEEELNAGYGIGTVFSLIRNNDVPINARRLISVPDLVSEYLTKHSRETPLGVTTPSLAQSFGCFDGVNSCFRETGHRAVGNLDLPRIVPSGSVVGRYRGEIPVIAAEGDNQAGFTASVRDPENSFFINIGTSAQISFKVGADDMLDESDKNGIELRPLIGESRLAVGATLGGGKSFSVLSNLVREIALQFCDSDGSAILDALSSTERPNQSQSLVVDPRFFGSRVDPQSRGSITGISGTNLNLRALYWGIADGVSEELFQLAESHVGIIKGGYVSASGNAVDRSPALRQSLSERFGVPVRLPRERETAARGIALVALATVEGGINRLTELRHSLVHYQDELSE